MFNRSSRFIDGSWRRNSMGVLCLFKPSASDKASAFCKCKEWRLNDSRCKSTKCHCGEKDCLSLAWSWDTNVAHPEAQISAVNVIFHPVYSQGTCVIRGNGVLEKQSIHYWEIKITSCFSGTDLMIGIGTDKVDLVQYQYIFNSVLGLDNQSWGYSYRGLIQNCGKLKLYGKKYTQGCIIGVYLDLFKGHLEFYVNRRPQGVAYRNIPTDENTPIYPLACSTSAKSAVKLLNASSIRECLQFRCMKVISMYPKMIEEVQKMPGLRQLCKDLWFLQLKEQYQYNEFKQNNLLLEDDAILCGLKNKKQKMDSDDDEALSTSSSSSSSSEACSIYNDMELPIHSSSTTTSDSSDNDDEINFVF